MRDLKFRVWDGSQWSYFTIGETWTDWAISVYSDHCLNGRKFYQYTGLKDISGKEIYDGDILKKHYGSEKPYVIVSWHEERAAFINNDGYNELLFEKSLYMCEIIGNIYENPELLNSDKEVQGSVARDDDSSTKAD